jgi:hypothetical protein
LSGRYSGERSYVMTPRRIFDNVLTKLGDSVVLGDLAEWTSLAYIAPTAKVTYVGLTKWERSKMIVVRAILGRAVVRHDAPKDIR